MPFSVNCTDFFGSIFVRAIFNQLILRVFQLMHREMILVMNIYKLLMLKYKKSKH